MPKGVIIQLALAEHETKEDRLQRAEGRLGQIAASASCPQLVILPELWGTGYYNFERYLKESEPPDGETYQRLAPFAAQGNFYILAGSIIEREGNDYFNTALLIGPNGSLSGVYRKIHLSSYHSEESQLLTPGSETLVIKNAYGTWGFATCYDLLFPELFRCLTDQGADTFFIIAAWPLSRLEHWLVLNRARAIENLAYVAACNCAGTAGGVPLAGASLVVDPYGVVQARGGQKEELLNFSFNWAHCAAARKEFKAIEDRRMKF